MTQLEAEKIYTDLVYTNLDLVEAQSSLEALLFMSDQPISSQKLQELLEAHLAENFSASTFQAAMKELQMRYQSSDHGIELVEIAGGFQFRTKIGHAKIIKKLEKTQTQRLSTGAMETLAIVAYQQPILKEEVDRIRGVDSSYFIRLLLEKKLTQISGRSELPGRPILYSTTEEFLQLFGLKDLSSLPSLRELEQMIPSSEVGKVEENEDPQTKSIRRLLSQMDTESSSYIEYDPKEDEKILKEIRERIQSVPVSTPFLEQQKEFEKVNSEPVQNDS